jgi:uncharacterized membrane protein
VRRRKRINIVTRIEISFKYELIVLIISSILAMGIYFQLIVNLSPDDIRGLVELLVTVNITAALSIAALVASMGTFRWDHYISALKHEGMTGDSRRKYIKEHAKKPLYKILVLNSAIIVVSLVTLLTSTPGLNTVYIFNLTIDWFVVTKTLIGINIVLIFCLIYQSLKYMKELLFR